MTEEMNTSENEIDQMEVVVEIYYSGSHVVCVEGK